MQDAQGKQFGARLAETARAWRNFIDKRLQPLGFSQPGWLIMLHLSKQPEGMTQTELANRIGISSASLSVQIDRLVKESWVERQNVYEDRRCNRIQLTDQAHDIAHQIMCVAAEVRNELLAGLSTEEITCCERVFTHILQRTENTAA